MKKKVLGCSFPIFVIVLVILVALFIIGFISGPIGSSLFPGVHLPSWTHISQPNPVLPAERIFINSPFLTNSIISAWLTIIVLVLLTWAGTRKAKLIPGKLQNFMEFIFESLYNFCSNVAGEVNGRKFFPLVSTIFLLVIFNAWIALLPIFGTITVPGYEFNEGIWEHTVVPLFRSANTDINLPLALALVSLIFVTFYGLRSRKSGYIKQFFNFQPLFKSIGQSFKGKASMMGIFIGFVESVVGLLELLGQITRVLSFTFRLFGNMIAGEILILLFTFLVPWLVAVPFYGLEMLVGFVQALIFGGLTLVFMTVAVESHSEHE